ncbi:ABC transporter substrate-binding protein [Acidocella aromatica]|uniref:Iron(III) transport system substrate-binding protein n=1 Tax=Acidocella aromatica TaxID=1303579 RepID=A0A840VCI5_9PROT|nr:extracellular solute-binding protein [Acidocella aromatica]MBB5373416.1 iron(III) transport system substrate-binding protein [Acidocella aromatica]
MRKLIAGAFAVIIAAIAAVLLWPSADHGLVLYSGLDYGPAVADAFTQETGIKIRVVRLATGSLLARMVAQGNHPDWALAWFDGATAAAALDADHLLATGLPAPAGLTAVGQSMLSADGAYIPTGFTLAGVFISDPARLPALPATWNDLLAPAYKGQVGMNDPSISGPSYPMLAGMLDNAGGWPQGQGFVRALKANGLHIFDKNDATLSALQSQAISLAIVQSSAAAFYAAHHPGLRVTIPSPAYVLPNVMVEAAGLSAKRQAEAARFMAFVMRPDIQRLRQAQGETDGDYWPITINAPAPPPGLPDISHAKTVTLEPTVWGHLESDINAWFAKVMTGA